jgi:hypothetical protein
MLGLSVGIFFSISAHVFAQENQKENFNQQPANQTPAREQGYTKYPHRDL